MLASFTAAVPRPKKESAMRQRLLLLTIALGFGLIALDLAVQAQRRAAFDPEAFEAAAAGYEAEILRDALGVPHIYGARDRDVAFGLAYAHMEDDRATFEEILPLYRGEAALFSGWEAIPVDFLIAWTGARDAVEAGYESRLSPEVRAVFEGYAAGLNLYAARHPEEVDRRLYPVSAKDLVTGFSIQHLFFYGFDGAVKRVMAGPEAVAEAPLLLAERYLGGDLPIGSNAFAVSPARSTDGATRVLGNSHQPLSGPVAWYEVHLESEEGWHMHGGLFPGSPIATIGATPNLAWGVTVNQPDLVDEFVLTTDTAHPDHYQLDGAWVPFETRSITLKVPLIGALYWPLTRTVRSTAHGPVLETDHGLYALRFAGHEEIRQPEQWYAMNRATNLEGWQAAMDLNAIASFNFVYGDRAGNIAFVHNSRSPLRAPGWDWKKRLPGDRSDLIWDQTQSFRANPQVLNPASGFVLSANQSPFAVTAEGDNPDPAAFPLELGLPTRMTNRADRGLELFASLPKVSAEDFEAIKFDKRYAAHSRSMAYVDSAQVLNAEAGSLLAEAQAVLAAWDRNTDLENPGAALGVCVLSEEWLAERAPRAPDPIEAQVLKCAEALKRHFGRLDPPWGAVNRLRRGGLDLPIAGGPDVLRAIYGREQTSDGRLTAVGGDGLMIFAEWAADGTPRLRTRHNFGSASTRPRSPHYADQAEAFAAETLRTVSWDRAALEAQATARTRLTATP